VGQVLCANSSLYSEEGPGHMFSKFCVFFVFLSLSVVACSQSTDDTYLEFEVDGKEYTLSSIVFMVSDLGDDLRFVSLGQDPLKVDIVSSMPTGGIAWKMKLSAIEDLRGLTLDLSESSKEVLDPMLQFSLFEDAGVAALSDSHVKIRILELDDDYLEGDVECLSLMFDSVSENTHRRVDLTGSFRASVQIHE
jgi:hypothetical protein